MGDRQIYANARTAVERRRRGRSPLVTLFDRRLRVVLGLVFAVLLVVGLESLASSWHWAQAQRNADFLLSAATTGPEAMAVAESSDPAPLVFAAVENSAAALNANGVVWTAAYGNDNSRSMTLVASVQLEVEGLHGEMGLFPAERRVLESVYAYPMPPGTGAAPDGYYDVAHFVRLEKGCEVERGVVPLNEAPVSMSSAAMGTVS